jgi:hypothetical protein
LKKVITVDVIHNIRIGKIHNLVAFFKIVNHEDVFDASPIQFIDEITSDKSGSAGYNDDGKNS